MKKPTLEEVYLYCTNNKNKTDRQNYFCKNDCYDYLGNYELAQILSDSFALMGRKEFNKEILRLVLGPMMKNREISLGLYEILKEHLDDDFLNEFNIDFINAKRTANNNSLQNHKVTNFNGEICTNFIAFPKLKKCKTLTLSLNEAISSLDGFSSDLEVENLFIECHRGDLKEDLNVSIKSKNYYLKDGVFNLTCEKAEFISFIASSWKPNKLNIPNLKKAKAIGFFGGLTGVNISFPTLEEVEEIVCHISSMEDLMEYLRRTNREELFTKVKNIDEARFAEVLCKTKHGW